MLLLSLSSSLLLLLLFNCTDYCMFHFVFFKCLCTMHDHKTWFRQIICENMVVTCKRKCLYSKVHPVLVLLNDLLPSLIVCSIFHSTTLSFLFVPLYSFRLKIWPLDCDFHIPQYTQNLLYTLVVYLKWGVN